MLVLGRNATPDLIKERTGFNSHCVCLDCLHQFDADLRDEMCIAELPFGLAGHVFRSPVPFGTYDLRGEGLNEYKEKNISVIVLLADDQLSEYVYITNFSKQNTRRAF